MRCVLIGAAEINNYEIYKKYLSSDDFFIFCDGGLKHQQNLNIKADLIVGDFDSWKEPLPDTEIIQLPCEKDDTDLFFAAKEGIKRGFNDFLILGAIGGRFDHSMVNISVLLYLYENHKKALLLDDFSEMEIVGNRSVTIDDCFSFFSLISLKGTSEGVTIRNAKYPLENASIKPEFQFVAYLAQFEVVPCAMNVPATCNQRIQDAAVCALPAARHHVRVGFVDALSIPVQICPVLGFILVPFRACHRIARGCSIVLGHDGAVHVARPVIVAMPGACVEFQRHVALETLLPPERPHGVQGLRYHVGPAGCALEAVDDLPVAAVCQPCVRGLVEVFVQHVGACDLAAGHVRQRHVLGEDAGAVGLERGGKALLEHGLLLDVQPEPAAFVAQRVFGDRLLDPFNLVQLNGLGERIALLLLHEQCQLVLLRLDGDEALLLAVGHGDMQF